MTCCNVGKKNMECQFVVQGISKEATREVLLDQLK